MKDKISGFYLLSFNLFALNQLLDESKNLRRNMFDSVRFDKSFFNLSYTCDVVLEDDCWFVILSKSTLL